jgi:hypothetical protein
MTKVIRNLAKSVTYLAAAALFSGCAVTAQSIDHADEVAQASDVSAEKVVFGKFRLLRNGQEVEFGEGIFANSARLHLFQDGADQEIVGKVGRDGEFAWLMEPGDYKLSSIAFKHRGETIEPAANFAFTVSADHDASYVGTITLEATFNAGYYGTSGVIERFYISNDCAAECSKMLGDLGMADTLAATSLLHWETQVASNR